MTSLPIVNAVSLPVGDGRRDVDELRTLAENAGRELEGAPTPVVHFEASRGKVKVNPLAAWTQADVGAYIARYDVPVNALIEQGYASVGCWPCTRRTEAGEDARAGRWPMFDKTECGLHTA